MAKINEDILEQTAMSWLDEFGYVVRFGPDIAFDGFRLKRTGRRADRDACLLQRFAEVR